MLSAVYIKGFKTFARPVRMPLEAGVTAIVGPNGSGKSNITDAVLFALGEQSPGVLRAGAMGELIFSGSETLPAANVAEVTLVFDNSEGAISLPYSEVAVTRRISRGGETDYLINGSRARMSDVRGVAGEAGLGRHSILRQGAVDAIVAGGAAACRLALEEAAGLGVHRRRRVSAARRLEKADVQLDKSRQLESELADQLRRIEAEAAAAREYRELESRYRELSLAHLYRVATRGLDGLRARLDAGKARSAELSARGEVLRGQGEDLTERLRRLEERLGRTDGLLEALEDASEDLRVQAYRADRALFRVEAGRGPEGQRANARARLEAELARLTRAVDDLERDAAEREAERVARREAFARAETDVTRARQAVGGAEDERSRLAVGVESLRARLARNQVSVGDEVLQETETARLRGLEEQISACRQDAAEQTVAGLHAWFEHSTSRVERLNEEAGRRRGALAAIIGRTEARARALQEAAPGGEGTRLYQVIRALPGYELAVEAALGDYGAGVLAQNLDEGVRLLSASERLALRLDARGVEDDGSHAGKPLLDCVQVVDEKYSGAVARLLDGMFVVEGPATFPTSTGMLR